MTIRKRLTLRFTGLVASILLLTFVSIYAFCWYYISQDFFRRLERRTSTTGDLLDAVPASITDLGAAVEPEPERPVAQPEDTLSSTNAIRLFFLPTIAGYRYGLPRRCWPVSGRTNGAISRKESTTHRRRATARHPERLWWWSCAENTYGDAFLLQLRWALAGLFSLIAGVTAFSGWIFAGDALRPMQQIDRVVNAIFPQQPRRAAAGTAARTTRSADCLPLSTGCLTAWPSRSGCSVCSWLTCRTS